MKSQESFEGKNASNEHCCNEQLLWIQFKKHLRSNSWWILLILASIILGLFTLGLLIDPSITRILWLCITGLLLVIILPVIVFFIKWIEQVDNFSPTESTNKSNIESHE